MAQSRDDLNSLARTVAAHFMAELEHAAKSGEDIQALLLKHEESQKNLMQGWPDEDVVIFTDAYVAELEAKSNSSLQESPHQNDHHEGSSRQERTLDRQAVRRYVKTDSDELLAAAARGENIHQIALDQQDRFNEQLKNLPPDEALALQAMYAEELNANTLHMSAEADRLNRQADDLNQRAAAETEKNEAIGKALGAIAFCVVFVLILMALRK
ncbi:hypothetical protein [Pseudomonas sp. p21]|uniref:hypothetical protein n=1 Tax=Pseudomonas sp. p21 TaxID=1825979 RepID=UPI000B30AE76|nr:hypothetical protein [Pseudomonas sp. p21]